ncbi:hypothetical protein D3C86_1830220 [compost metagenome]
MAKTAVIEHTKTVKNKGTYHALIIPCLVDLKINRTNQVVAIRNLSDKKTLELRRACRKRSLRTATRRRPEALNCLSRPNRLELVYRTRGTDTARIVLVTLKGSALHGIGKIERMNKLIVCPGVIAK